MSRIVTPAQVRSEGHSMLFLAEDGTHCITDGYTPVLRAAERCDAVCGKAVCVLPAGHSSPVAIPPTAEALLRALHEAGGSLPYSDERVTTSGLTWLRHEKMARVVTRSRNVFVDLTAAGREAAAALVTR